MRTTELPDGATALFTADRSDPWAYLSNAGKEMVTRLAGALADLAPATREEIFDEVLTDLRAVHDETVAAAAGDMLARVALLAARVDADVGNAMIRGGLRLALGAGGGAAKLRRALYEPNRPLDPAPPKLPLMPAVGEISCIAGIVDAMQRYSQDVRAVRAWEEANKPTISAEGITGIDPPHGRSGDTVTIHGAFDLDPGETRVVFTSWAGKALPVPVVSPDTAGSATTLTVQVPGLVGYGPVALAHVPDPATPRPGPASSHQVVGEVTACQGPLVAAGFTLPDLVPTVKFDAPAALPGEENLFDGGPRLDDAIYEVEVGDRVTLAGHGLRDGDRVRLRHQLLSASVTTPKPDGSGMTQIGFTVPARAPGGWYPVDIVGPEAPNGAISQSNPVTLKIHPTLESVEPASVWVNDIVTVRGTGFPTDPSLTGEGYGKALPLQLLEHDTTTARYRVVGEPPADVFPSGSADVTLGVAGWIRQPETGPVKLRLNRVASLAGARRFAPQVRLHSDETHFPSSVPWFLRRCSLVFPAIRLLGHAVPDALPPNTIVSNGAAILAREGELNTGNLTEFNVAGISSYGPVASGEDSAPIYALNPSSARDGEKHRFWAKGKPRKGRVAGPDAYVHIQLHDGMVDFQYWTFYPFSGRIGADPGMYDHDGDWEHITVRVRGTEILGLYLSAHEGREPQWRGTRAFQFVPAGDGFEHPVAYSARHSHAAYESAGEHVRDGLLPNDHTDDRGPWWCLWERLVEVTDSTRWAFFRGMWGIEGKAPRSPGLKPPWRGTRHGPPNSVWFFAMDWGRGSSVWSSKVYSQVATGEEYGHFTTVRSVLLLSVTPGTVLDLEYANGHSRITVKKLSTDITAYRLDQSWQDDLVRLDANFVPRIEIDPMEFGSHSIPPMGPTTRIVIRAPST